MSNPLTAAASGIESFVCGFLIGAVAMAAIFIVISAWSGGQVAHDPKKMLELRSACLATSPNVLTTYCDNYAERYSRIEKKQ